MSILEKDFTLYNGVDIPAIGFGTWQIEGESAAFTAVNHALEAGYRHIDTAYVYGNETGVGRAVHGHEGLFITSKLPAEIKTYAGAMESFQKTMKNLNLDVLDLYLIHAPWPWNDQGSDHNEGNVAAWKALEELYKSGLCRAIGVSNFEANHIQYLLDRCEIIPMVNQIRYCIGFTQEETVSYCREQAILVEGYSPLATGKLLGNKQIAAVASQYGKSVAQLSIRYCLEKDVLPLPKSTDPGRIRENADVDFTILPQDLETLDNMQNTVANM